MKKILVTGGGGYIGAHTIVDLVQNGMEVISVDNFSRSTKKILEGVEYILNRKIKNYAVDLCDYNDTHAIFMENPDIDGIIHFAAYKSVSESVENPLMYYHNNMVSLINLMQCAEEFKIQYFVFSSSCTVYGNADVIPVTEDSPIKQAESPYGLTKQLGEQLIVDFSKHKSNLYFCLLRYFNPVGAHPSALIGELPVGKPSNLVPAITQTAIGKLPVMQVYGNDYPTRDGTCIRDYIHVCDIAHAHTLAVEFLMKHPQNRCEVFNLGTGNGISVLEAINAFERISDKKLNYIIGNRRAGDVVAIYANNDKAKHKLNWNTQYTLDDMMQTAWNWELRLHKDESMFQQIDPQMN